MHIDISDTEEIPSCAADGCGRGCLYGCRVLCNGDCGGGYYGYRYEPPKAKTILPIPPTAMMHYLQDPAHLKNTGPEPRHPAQAH